MDTVEVHDRPAATAEGPLRAPSDRGQHIAEWLPHYARTQPDRPALANLDTGETRTWAELEDRVGRLAHSLRHDLGLQAGERIVSLTNGDLRCFELQFACLRAGLIWAPLNFRFAAPELAHACAQIAPSLMITDAEWSEVAAQVAGLAGGMRLISWSGEDAEFEHLARTPHRMAERPYAGADEPAFILMTSGTTDRPKAAVVTRGGLFWQAINQMQFCRVAEPNSHVFVPLPLFHAGGLNSLCNPVLYFGGSVTVSARFDADTTARFVGDPANGVTHLALVPLMYQMMADSPGFGQTDLSGMRCIICAGGRLPERLRAAFAARGGVFTTQYGGTETGPTITAMDVRRQDKILEGSCGQQALHVQIRLVGPDGRDVAVGEPGEVWVRGPAVIPRYIARDRELDFVGDWFRTGDVARQDADGFYFIVDRIKEMYKSGGENVAPAEVELVLGEHPAISEVAIIGVPDERWGEVGLAVVVPAAGADLTVESLRAFCEGRLARFKHPRRMAFVDALPRNVTGKIARDDLRRRFGGSKTV